MYEGFFGFSYQPFGEGAGNEFLVLTDTHRRAFDEIKGAVISGQSGIILTGDAGVGKTAILRALFQDGDLDDGFNAAYIQHPSGDPDRPLSWVLTALGLDPGAAGLNGTLGQIETALAELHAAGRRPLLLIDEAQTLTDADIAALGKVMALDIADGPPCQMVLAGPSVVAGMFRDSALPIGCTVELKPMDVDDTFDYIHARVRRAGGEADALFDQMAVLAIHDRAQGSPRLTNMLCDICLVSARRADRKTIDIGFAETAMAEWLDFGIASEEPDPTPETDAPEPEVGNGAHEEAASPPPATEAGKGPETVSEETPPSFMATQPVEQHRATFDPAEVEVAGADHSSGAEASPRPRGKHLSLPAAVAGMGVAASIGAAAMFVGLGGAGSGDPGMAVVSRPDPVAAKTAQDALDRARADLSEMQQRAETARAAADEAEGRAARLAEETNAAFAARDKAVAALKASQEELGALGQKMDIARAEVADLTARRDQALAETETAEAGAKTLSETLAALESEIAAARQGLAQLASEPSAPHESEAQDLAALDPGVADGPTGTIVSGAGPTEPAPQASAPEAAIPVEAQIPEDAVRLAELPADPDLAETLFLAALDRTEPREVAVAYARAASVGHSRAAYYLGQMYDTGDGVAFAPETAREWYAAAAAEIDSAAALMEMMQDIPASGPTFAEPLSSQVDGGVVDLVWQGRGPFVVELASRPGPATAFHETARSAVRLAASPDLGWWRVTPRGGVPGDWIRIGDPSE